MQSGSSHIPIAIETSLVRLVTVLSAAAAIAYLTIGWYSGETPLVAAAIGPALVSIVGISFLRLDYHRILPLLIVTALAIVVEDSLLGIQDIAPAAGIPLVVVGITGAFFIPRKFVIPFIGVFTTVVFISRLNLLGDEIHLLQATLGGAFVAFGASLLSWINREFERREERHHNLFQHAPVPMWKEDFSEAGTELEAVAARGIANIDDYLAANPEEVRRLASLVRVTDVNDAAVRLTEAPDRSVLLGSFGMDTLSSGSLDSFVTQFMAIANDTEKVSTELVGGLTVTGRPIEALLVWSAPRVDGALDLSNVTVAIVDITRQRAAERKLQDLLRSKDQFVATISHELRTPLTTVVGIAEELRDANGSIDEAERFELLSLMADQGLDMSGIIDDLLVVARSEAGNLIIALQPVDLGAEILRSVHAIDPMIAVETNGSSVMVNADPQRVRQITRNLITNAHRYGGPTIRVVVGSHERGGFLEVRDDGEPLSLSARSEIFEPYTRANQQSGTTESVGLGLTVSRRLARRMGGDLDYGHDGDETVFTLTLGDADQPVATS